MTAIDKRCSNGWTAMAFAMDGKRQDVVNYLTIIAAHEGLKVGILKAAEFGMLMQVREYLSADPKQVFMRDAAE